MGALSWLPYLNKWWTFTASIAVALCCGLSYVFSIWSGVLKDAYGLSQGQLELIASSSNAGGYCGIFSGLVFDALVPHKKFGPRFVLFVVLVANATGYVGLWAAASGRFTATFWQLCALAFVAANGGTWGDTAILVSNVRNFPSSRGSVVGVLKASIGLSGSLFAAVYQGLFLPNKTSFLLFLAAAPTAVGLLALPLVNRCEFVQRSEVEARTHVFSAEGRFVFTLQALGTLGVYLITGATFGSLYPLSQAARLTVTVGAGLLLLPLALIPYGSGGLLSHKAHLHHALSHYPDQEQDPNRSGSPTDGAPDEEQGSGGARVAAAGGGGEAALTQPLLGDGPEQEGNGSAAAAVDALDSLEPAVPDADAPQPPAAAAPSTAAAAAAVLRAKQLPVQLSPVECLRSKDWWLLFLVLCIGMGSGLTLLNNLAQLVKAVTQGASAREITPVLVSVFSVCNCAGRMMLGYLPERLLHQRGTPRLLFLPLVSALMASTCLTLAFAHLPLLYPLCALAGFAFGGFWSLAPSLISELFGLARFAANYTMAQFAPMLGSFGLAAGLSGWVYERALRRHGGTDSTCIGSDCFGPTFITLAVLGAGGTTAAVALYRRTYRVYAAEYAEVHQYDQEVLRRHINGDGHSSLASLDPTPPRASPNMR